MSENKRFVVKKCEKEFCTHDTFFDEIVSICDVERIEQNTCNLLNQLWEQMWLLNTEHTSKMNDLGMIDNIVTKTDLNNHKACIYALKRIDEITNGYGDVYE